MHAPAPAAGLTPPPWPALWRGRQHFCVLHTGPAPAGLKSFVRLWRAWRQDPERCQHLHGVLLCENAVQGLEALLGLEGLQPAEPAGPTYPQQAMADQPTALPGPMLPEPLAPSLAELRAQLQTQWPPLTPNLHPLELDGGRVRLLLCIGPMHRLLPRLRLQADVLWLEGLADQPFAPAPVQQASPHTLPAPSASPLRTAAPRAPHGLRLLKALARLARPGALACGAFGNTALWAALRTAGFTADPQAPPGQVWARHQPHGRSQGQRRARSEPAAQAQAAAQVPAAPPRTALVVGAGVAGAAAAQALARLGVAVTVLDRQPQAASETSGNAAALFHGTVNPDDGPYARLFRAAALVAQRDYAAACAPLAGPVDETLAWPSASAGTGPVSEPGVEPGAETGDGPSAEPGTEAPVVPGGLNGLLRLQRPDEGETAQALQGRLQQQLHRLGLPAGYVQVISATQASALAGRALNAPAWFYPGGGWVDPAAWVRQALQTPGVRFAGQQAVQAIRRHAQGWQALDAEGRVLGQADVLVLACAVNSLALLPDPPPPWPLRQTRGQVTQLQVHTATGQRAALGLPVAGDGYALPLTAPGAVLCGATRHAATLRDRPGPFGLRGQTWGTAPASPDDAAAAPTGGHHSPIDDQHGTHHGSDHQHNLRRLYGLTGLQPAPGSAVRGRVGWRLHSDDRLPIVGPVPQAVVLDEGRPEARSGAPGPVRVDQARRWPREAGLFVLTALGARGLSLAPLLGRLVAAQATGTPWPVEQDLADAVDPVRWALRAERLRQAKDLEPGGLPPAETPGPPVCNQEAG